MFEKDLPAPDLSKISDRYERFELSLPFCRTNIIHFARHIDEAENYCGGRGFVTLESLQNEFRTPAWNALRRKGSPLKKFLSSPYFKN